MVPDGGYSELRAFVQKHTGLNTVILGYQNASARPSLPYVMLHMLSERARSGPESRAFTGPSSADTTPFIETPSRPWEWVWQVTVYGDGGTGLLRKIDAAINVPQAHIALRPYAIHETTGIRNVPEKVDGSDRYEQRANMDITLHAVIREGIDVDMADSGPIDVNTN